MVKLVFVAFVTVGIFAYSANALQCYSCERCSENQKSWEVINNCGNVVGQDQAACAKIIATDKTGGESTSRRCVILKKTQNGLAFDCQPGATESERKCQTCTSDLCNSATSVNLTAFTIVGVMLMLIISRF